MVGLQLPFHSTACLIGQLYFHSTSFPLHPHIVCFPVGTMENEEIEGKENSSYKMLLENVLLRKQTATRDPLQI